MRRLFAYFDARMR